MIIISLFGDYTSSIPKQKCTHCEFSSKEVRIVEDLTQPNPYLHDKDSSMLIFPILENSGSKAEFISDIKFIFKDKHYCSDINKITFVFDNKNFSVLSNRWISCQIRAIVRLNEEQINILKIEPINQIIIENLVTDNIYYYDINDKNYFIKTFSKISKK